jgi:hypothetical protein
MLGIITEVGYAIKTDRDGRDRPLSWRRHPENSDVKARVT